MKREFEYDGQTHTYVTANPNMKALNAYMAFSSDAFKQAPNPEGDLKLYVKSIDDKDPFLAPPEIQWIAFMQSFAFLAKVFEKSQDLWGG